MMLEARSPKTHSQTFAWLGAICEPLQAASPTSILDRAFCVHPHDLRRSTRKPAFATHPRNDSEIQVSGSRPCARSKRDSLGLCPAWRQALPAKALALFALEPVVCRIVVLPWWVVVLPCRHHTGQSGNFRRLVVSACSFVSINSQCGASQVLTHTPESGLTRFFNRHATHHFSSVPAARSCGRTA